MNVWLSKYQLHPKKQLTAKSSGVKPLQGALLRVEFAQGFLGYADLHPHEELGDISLEQQLSDFLKGKVSHQLQCSLRLAKVDGEFRRRGESAFTGLTLPDTHHLGWPDEVAAEEYTHFKLKMGINLFEETSQLKRLLSFLTRSCLRLDFNESLSEEQFFSWWGEVEGWLKDYVDYIEDPYEFSENWMVTGEGLFALDRGLSLGHQYSGVNIVKPAIVDSKNYSGGARTIFSCYMDHPLGEMSAIYESAKFYSEPSCAMEVCGLRTWNLFEPNAYSEVLKNLGTEIDVASGTGFGFDDLLENENWIPLKNSL